MWISPELMARANDVLLECPFSTIYRVIAGACQVARDTGFSSS
jgi:hypothetical protein